MPRLRQPDNSDTLLFYANRSKDSQIIGPKGNAAAVNSTKNLLTLLLRSSSPEETQMLITQSFELQGLAGFFGTTSNNEYEI